MLNGMHLCGIHDRFIIGTGHAQVKGSDDRVTDRVFTRYIDTRNQTDMVYSKACNFFHNYGLLVVSLIIAKFVDKGKEER